jgi:hypothetical protein
MACRSMEFGGHVVSRINRAVRFADAVLHAMRAGRAVGDPKSALRKLRMVLLLSAAAIVATAVAGCGGDGVGALLVDPARFDALHCKDLVAQWKGLVANEKKLRDLIDKANDGGVGTVIGDVAYRSDYETVLAQEKLLQRTAAAQKCQLVATYASDQGIR